MSQILHVDDHLLLDFSYWCKDWTRLVLVTQAEVMAHHSWLTIWKASLCKHTRHASDDRVFWNWICTGIPHSEQAQSSICRVYITVRAVSDSRLLFSWTWREALFMQAFVVLCRRCCTMAFVPYVWQKSDSYSFCRGTSLKKWTLSISPSLAMTEPNAKELALRRPWRKCMWLMRGIRSVNNAVHLLPGSAIALIQWQYRNSPRSCASPFTNSHVHFLLLSYGIDPVCWKTHPTTFFVLFLKWYKTPANPNRCQRSMIQYNTIQYNRSLFIFALSQQLQL